MSDRRTVLSTVATVLGAVLGIRVASAQEARGQETIPIPPADGAGRATVMRCTAEPPELFEPGKVKYDFASHQLYVQDYDGCYYQLHISGSGLTLPHD